MQGKKLFIIFTMLAIISPFILSCDPDCNPPKIEICMLNIIKIDPAIFQNVKDYQARKFLMEVPLYTGDASCKNVKDYQARKFLMKVPLYTGDASYKKDKNTYDRPLEQVDGYLMTNVNDYNVTETYHDNLCRMLKNCNKNMLNLFEDNFYAPYVEKDI